MLSRSSQGYGTILFNQIKHVKQSNIKQCSACVTLYGTESFYTSAALNENKSTSVDNADEDSSPNGHTPPLLKTKGVVPGKGPPPEPPLDCCMSGCVNCVWIAYAESLKDYYVDGGKSAREAIEQIENPSLKMFIKLEMGLL